MVSCSENNNQNTRTLMLEQKQIQDSTNIKIALKVFEYFNKHDWKNKASLFAPVTICLDPSYGKVKVKKTREEIIKKYIELQKQIPDIHDEIKTMYASGDSIVTIEIVAHGTLADKTDLNLPICVIFKIKNGLIVEDCTYYDN